MLKNSRLLFKATLNLPKWYPSRCKFCHPLNAICWIFLLPVSLSTKQVDYLGVTVYVTMDSGLMPAVLESLSYPVWLAVSSSENAYFEKWSFFLCIFPKFDDDLPFSPTYFLAKQRGTVGYRTLYSEWLNGNWKRSTDPFIPDTDRHVFLYNIWPRTILFSNIST